MALETLQSFGDDEGGEELPTSGMQSMTFYPDRDPKFDGSGLPTAEGAAPVSITDLIASYRETLYGDASDGLIEADAALQRLEAHLAATGIGDNIHSN